MASAVKWIKLTTDMFEDDKIDMILKLPEGDALLVIWIRLLTMAGKSNSDGYILLNKDIAYDADMLASKCNKSTQVIKYALTTFEKFQMVELNDNGILVRNFNKHQDLDKLNRKREADRLRQQKHRQSSSLLPEPKEGIMSRVTTCDSECDTSYSYSYINNNNIIYNSKNDAKNDNYIKFFNENFHLITPYEAQILNSFIMDGLEEAVITKALMIAVESNVRDVKYVKKILNTWLEKGLNTIDKVNCYNLEFERKKNSKRNPNEGGRYTDFDFGGEVL